MPLRFSPMWFGIITKNMNKENKHFKKYLTILNGLLKNQTRRERGSRLYEWWSGIQFLGKYICSYDILIFRDVFRRTHWILLSLMKIAILTIFPLIHLSYVVRAWVEIYFWEDFRIGDMVTVCVLGPELKLGIQGSVSQRLRSTLSWT